MEMETFGIDLPCIISAAILMKGYAPVLPEEKTQCRLEIDFTKDKATKSHLHRI